jgi:hypothetical protein
MATLGKTLEFLQNGAVVVVSQRVSKCPNAGDFAVSTPLFECRQPITNSLNFTR